MDFSTMSASQIAKGISEGKIKAVDVVSAAIARAKKMEPILNACVTLMEEEAMEQAKRIDSKILKGEKVGKLAGVPYFAKDNMCTKGTRTTCSSKMLANWVPTYDATVIELMESAGAILMGKTNMDEFAMGSSTETSFWGVTKNPRDVTRVPGGSSGGSAVVVAAGYAPISLGSDTGGSVRQPAAFCGVHGFKPSYGQVSRHGIVGYASSFDQVSPFARSIEDIALVMDVIAQPDARDMMCDSAARPQCSGEINDQKDSLKGKKIALFSGFNRSDIDPDVLNALDNTVKLLEAQGAVVDSLEMPITARYAVASYYVLASADASAKMAAFDGIRFGHHVDGENLFDMYTKTRTDGFGEEVKKRILLGTTLLSSGYHEDYFLPAVNVRVKLKEEFEEVFSKYDAVLMPVAPSLPYHLGEKESNPTRMYLGDVFTVPINMAGVAGLSLNVGFNHDGLPLNVQIVTPRYADKTALSIGAAIEQIVKSPEIASIKEVE